MEDTKIQHEIYTEMKKFMHASGLKKTPGHKPKETDIHLWKQYSKAYRNNRTGDWTRPFRINFDVLSAIDVDVKRRNEAGETNHLRQFHPARILRYA